MQDFEEVSGMVMKVEPNGEYGRRVVLLTTSKGKISAFARNARKPNNKLIAATSPFCFGQFKLIRGKSSYTLIDAEISHYFDELRSDYEAVIYGTYFLEMMDYYTHENLEANQQLKLLYLSLRALAHPSIPKKLVRYIFELKALMLEGEFPGIPTGNWLDSTIYTIQFIETTEIEKMYTFKVTDEVLTELAIIGDEIRNRCVDRIFHSLEYLLI